MQPIYSVQILQAAKQGNLLFGIIFALMCNTGHLLHLIMDKYFIHTVIMAYCPIPDISQKQSNNGNIKDLLR